MPDGTSDSHRNHVRGAAVPPDMRRNFLQSLAASGLLLVVPAAAVRAAELHAGDGSSRTPEPLLPGRIRTLAFFRERRALQVARVTAYARRGVFPRNIDFRGARVPYFVDDRGVACAVANLMIEDGLREVVGGIAAENNHVRVMDVSSGPLVDWVLESGLLQEEAARIQPSYDFERPYRPRPTPVDPAIVERRRIQRHLERVVAELRRDTETNVVTALERWERRLRG